MARLLRAHFASIGHGDARLAPLTLDFRHAGGEADAGRAADTVIWLRNAGGKSSILNLLYSVFRPSAREFLGSSAEGKARKLGDYVQGRDLAFVVTEWDVDPPEGLELFATAPRGVRIAGQVLAWKGQRRSADLGNLRRLFFSVSADPERDLTFDSLPIHGLGEPADSFDAFHHWLREASHEHGGQELVFTQNQGTWLGHLEKVGLDPELFRYQLKMNQREGAADEAFRFSKDVDFIRFLLELALDPQTADGVAQNLQAQQENLRLRPTWELERRFVSEAVGDVRELAAAVRSLRTIEEEFGRVAHEVAAVAAGLAAHAGRSSEAADEARGRAEASREAGRRASNQRDMMQRWSRGLDRLARTYDEAEAKVALDGAEERGAALRSEARHVGGAIALAAVWEKEHEERSLREALAQEREELEPLRLAACQRGAVLYRALDAEHRRLTGSAADRRRAAEDAERSAAAAADRHTDARERRGRAEAERDAVDARIARRDRARETLLEAGAVENREPATEAMSRWRCYMQERAAAGEAAQRRRDELADGLQKISERREDVKEARAAAGRDVTAFEERLREALRWRDRLLEEKAIREVEEVEEPNLEAPGLEGRLRRRAGGARAELLASRVEGAEDARSLEWLREHGLLPSPLDVRRVVDAIRAAGHPAHAGPEYLEQNLPAEEAARRLRSDPARFSGVIVTTSPGLEAAAAATIDGLRAPVQATLVQSLAVGEVTAHAHVVLPDAGLWDRAAADGRRTTLERSVERRGERERRWTEEETELGRLAEELRRYLDAHGSGGLLRLERDADEMREQLRRADDELAELGRRGTRAREELEATQSRIRELEGERASGERAFGEVERFVREHEDRLEEARRAKTELVASIEALEELAEEAKAEVRRRRDEAKAGLEAAFELDGRLREVRVERDGIAHRGPDSSARAAEEPGADESDAESGIVTSIDAARIAYETARRAYEGELSESRLKWQLERCDAELAERREELERRARELDRARVEELAGRSDLHEEAARVEGAIGEQRSIVARARILHETARAALAERKSLRRDVEDLPSDRERPADAASARRMIAELEEEIEEHGRLAQAALDQVREHETEASALRRASERCQSKETLLRSAGEMASVELAELPPRQPPSDPDAMEAMVDALRVRFGEAHQLRVAADEEAAAAKENVRAIADRTEFAGLTAQYRERMKDPAEVIFGAVADLDRQLTDRLAALDDALAKLDEDRCLIVEQLMHLAQAVGKLLKRTESASRLPASLDAWGGKGYVRIGFSFPERDDNVRARLEPLVDRIVAQAQLPSGLELVVQTAIELAGQRGFQVKILKPDTVLRPEPIPLSQMSTFSRGQQLTAAILLYCTLVQLRARTRGRGQGTQDGGVLILDNPIGTCSNASLLNLQRAIAERMRVQLVYTTGVDDLEALATLPNKIRLRNTHRDRATGQYHVTEDPDAHRGSLEAVRLVEVPAR